MAALSRREAVIAAFAAGLAGPALARATILAAVPIGRTDLGWWRRRHEEKLARLRQGPVDLVWLGDSITEHWELPEYQPVWNRFYGGRHAINLGFIGDTTASVLWRIGHGEVGGIAPRALVLLIGANNLGHVHWSASETLAGITAIVDDLQRRLPRTGIVLLGVLPRAGDDWVMSTQAETNRLLAARYGQGQPKLTYIDLSPVFAPGGRIDPALYADPAHTPPEPALHPNVAGMTRIAEAIEPSVARYMGDRPRGTA